MEIKRDTPLRYFPGVGEKTGEKLAKLGLFTAEDIIKFFPRRYEFRGEVCLLADALTDAPCATVLTICSHPSVRQSAGGLKYVKVMASDESGTATLTFFNQPWMEKSLSYGRKFRVWGRVNRSGYAYEVASPELEPYSPALPSVLPVYPLTKGVSQSLLRRIAGAARALIESEPDVLPGDIRDRYGLMSKGAALSALHFPQTRAETESARRTLAFEELFVFQLALKAVRGKHNRGKAPAMSFKDTGIGRFFTSLPFSLTTAQERVIKEVLGGMCSDVPMCRMVQGDVGCGKTVIAAGAMLFTVKNGFQCAMMAPTEILAHQHYETLSRMFEGFDISLALLTGSTPSKEKRAIKKGLADGSISAVVGTNAIIEADVAYDGLGLVITDEQHRFGVMQRASLADKSHLLTPHSLVMSATPIPRSMSLILYGDMELSVIDSLPPGRQPIQTRCADNGKRRAMYGFLAKQIVGGRQAYIICPLVEDTENGYDDKKSVESYKSEFEKALPFVRAVCLHGRMKSAEKAAAMSAFEKHEADVLISTTVVEVGVNVPNATVMVIENAECFGLSQLHQLRGRVGRGEHKSFCILMTEKSTPRLEVLCRTCDGFAIAAEDLKLRGPGDFFGSRQSGEARFVHASAADMPLVEATRTLVDEVYAKSGIKGYEDAINVFFKDIGSENIFN